MKFGICSEIFQQWRTASPPEGGVPRQDVERTIHFIKQLGYDGLEIAPFTIADYVSHIPSATRRAVASAAKSAGIDIIGLHWILVGPGGMHLNHPDRQVRWRTARYLRELARCCADMGGRLLIFGSPKQRAILPGVTYEQAFDFAVETFQEALPACESEGVTICMEPLSTEETDFCSTAAETVRLVDAVNHTNFRMMLDTKAMTTDEAGRPELIRRFASYIEHYHANDANLHGPGQGDVDFGPIFDALRDVDYDRYVSVEVFNFDPGPEKIARDSLAYMRQFVPESG